MVLSCTLPGPVRKMTRDYIFSWYNITRGTAQHHCIAGLTATIVTKPGTQEEYAVSTAQLNFSSHKKVVLQNRPIYPHALSFKHPCANLSSETPRVPTSLRYTTWREYHRFDAVRNMFPVQAPRGSSNFSSLVAAELSRCQFIKAAARVASPSGLHGSSTLAMPRLEQTVRIASHGPSVPLVCFFYSGVSQSGWSTASQSCTPWLRIAKRAAASAGNTTRVTSFIGRRLPVRLT